MNPIIFLHGALGTAEQLHPLTAKLNDNDRIHRFSFEGHGEAAEKDRPFRIEYFADNTLSYMDQHEIDQADFFGYSMGGYVALYLAKYYPKRVGRVATLGTVLKWSPEKSSDETAFLDTDKIEEKVPKFARMLEEQHPEDWRKVVLKTKELLRYLGENPNIKDVEWKSINHPIRIHIGDSDATAGLNDTIQVYNVIPNAQLVVLPNSYHPIHKVDTKILAQSLNEFLHM